MYAINYKGFTIKGYFDKKEVYIIGTSFGGQSQILAQRFNSLHGAKCVISKWLNKGL